MSEISTEGRSYIPEYPVLVLPNRVDMPTLRALEEALGGPSRVAWLVEVSQKPGADIMQHLSRTRAAGILCAIDRMSREMLSDQIHDMLAQGRYVVLLPGRPAQAEGSLSDVPQALLSFFNNTTLQALPVYAGRYNRDFSRAMVTEGESDELKIRFMPLLRAGAALGERVLTAWMEASAIQMESHPFLEKNSLVHVLLEGIRRHPNAVIIDGVNDTRLTHRHLLALALMMSRHFRRQTSNKRLGIILPPGKLAAIANLACLLAGIVPVNINTDLPASDFRQQASLAGLDRFVTERRYMQKKSGFAWPRQRDLLFIEQELNALGGFSFAAWKALARFGNEEQFHRLPGIAEPGAEDEAMLFFTRADGEKVRGVPFSHRMLMAGAMQIQARWGFKPGDRLLSVTPFHLTHGLMLGLLTPLMLGCDTVTYPSPHAGRRVCELIHNYGTILATATPVQVREWLAQARPDTFSSMRHLLVTGEKLPLELVQRARRACQLELMECYCLTVAAAPVAANLPSPEEVPAGALLLPANRVGSVGAPLPGMAVRICDPDREEVQLLPSQQGTVWLRGPSVAGRHLSAGGDASSHLRGNWLGSGDVGQLAADGMLSIHGRRTRFSRINGEMVPHEMLEEVLCRVLGVDAASRERRLAVVGVPHRDTGDQLVLLSTLHKVVSPHDQITLRYGVTNAHYPFHWAPEKIVAVRSIPVLPNGKLDYALCYRIACQALRVKER